MSRIDFGECFNFFTEIKKKKKEIIMYAYKLILVLLNYLNKHKIDVCYIVLTDMLVNH